MRVLGENTKVRPITGDMTNEADIARLLPQIGTFDHLVSTAGTPPPGDPIERTDIDIVHSFIDNKLIGALLVAEHAVRTLKRGGSMPFTSARTSRLCPTGPS